VACLVHPNYRRKLQWFQKIDKDKLLKNGLVHAEKSLNICLMLRKIMPIYTCTWVW
jgi:hypothetical protein